MESIKGLLKQSIDERIIKEFLVNQVISAYLFTVPGAAPGFRFIESENNYITLAEEELATSKADPTYFRLIRFSKGTGKATRVGLVPLELGFEEFTIKFKEVWTRAIELYNKAENLHDTLPCFLIRIFPSEDGLKDIMLEGNKQNKPLEVVRELIKASVSAEDSVSILSLIQKAPNGKVALTKAIQAIFDNRKSSLKMMTSACSDILSKSSKLLKRFDQRKIDQSLFADYQIKDKSIFYLGKKIAERALEAGEEATKNEFQERMNKTLKGITDISQADAENTSKCCFQRTKVNRCGFSDQSP